MDSFNAINRRSQHLFVVSVQENLMLNHYAWLLAICISLPDVLKVLQTSWRIIFGKKEKPVRSVFIFVSIK